LRNFGRRDEDTLNLEIVEGLIDVLNEHNGLVRLFRIARDRCNAVFEDGLKSRIEFDVIIEFKGGLPQRINKLHQSYMSLHFPLLFVFGEPGFYPELVMKPRDGSGKAFSATEQSRIDLIRKNQNDLRSDYLLGLYDAILQVLYTIEFQKRGLPHCYTLLWVYSSSKIQDASQINKYISVELPDLVEDPKGYKVVSKLMMHGPCDVANPSASCTEKGICKKHFPKMYNENTFFDTNGHTHYRRRQTQVHVMKGESRLDNCNVVPYNRILCLDFRAHINVEYCGWSMLIKYLFKYISKRPDRILGKIDRLIEDASTSTGKRHI
nr:DNA helicase [Tanacetum cinerariifolium]